jgi:hypothetical protein
LLTIAAQSALAGFFVDAKAKERSMRTIHLLSLAIVSISALHFTNSVADEELPWRGYSVVDEPTSRLVYGVTKSYLVDSAGGTRLERRIGFQCNNVELILTLDIGEFLAASSTDFELSVWVDGADLLGLDMRSWSNSTSGGYSRVEVIAKRLFDRMIAGTRLSWRITRDELTTDGTFSLIGFTAASRDLVANCVD